MTPERQDHMTTQYIWALENDNAFITRARPMVEQGRFDAFRTAVSDAIRPTRALIGELNSHSIRGVEWSFLYLEMWVQMGGSTLLFSSAAHRLSFQFQLDRLREHGFALSPHGCVRTHTSPQPIPVPSLQTLAEPEKETIMSTQINIKNVTFINGVDVTDMTDAQLIEAIKKVEAEIATLKAVGVKSTKIAAKITEAEATLAKVVEILDAR